ncbi:aspartate transaminase AspB [Bacillus carboniphilus]|uniref:Aminotransferase n=1 Tax=Bacillus carboniphilus TaxID=86663 RepID=A0ABN0WVL7_9BACI
MKLSNRVAALSPSSTLAITAKAKQLKEEGKDVIGLGAGEPDFNTPQHIIDAAIKSMEEGKTKYTAADGLLELKKAIAHKLKVDQGLDYEPNEIIVSSGAKHSLYTLFQALLDEGDEVIVPSPYWVSYPEQVKLADGTPIIVEGKEENDFKITPGQLKEVISPNTKALIINSPSNPTGMLYSKEELTAIAEFCLENNLIIISDEIYEKLIYNQNSHFSIAQISPQVKDITVIINGVSKSHSMTGWRIGFAAGNKELIKAMTNLSSHSTSNPTTISQYGAIAAYGENQEPVEMMRKAFEERLEEVYAKLIEIPGFTCLKPQGAFYLFPNAKKAAEMTGFANVDDFAKALLDEALVAVVPGSGFGSPDNLRISYATSKELILEALDRINQFIHKHKK